MYKEQCIGFIRKIVYFKMIEMLVRIAMTFIFIFITNRKIVMDIRLQYGVDVLDDEVKNIPLANKIINIFM